MPDYDPNTTYLIFTPEYAFNGMYKTVTDMCGNLYNLDSRFPYNATSNPFYTYSNNSKNLNNIHFYQSSLPPPGTSSFNNYFTRVILGTNVTSIGISAFETCKELSSVTIPNSVTSIGDDAFNICNLNSVVIPNSVKTIGMLAFANNYNLTTITIGNSVSSIGDNAFQYIARYAPNTVTLNWGTNEYVANYFYTNINNSLWEVNFIYNPPYPTSQTPAPGVTDVTGPGKSSHYGYFELSWSGTDKTTGTAVTGTYTGSVSSTGDSYTDAHDASSEKTQAYVKAYLKNNVTNKHKKVHYTIQHTSAL